MTTAPAEARVRAEPAGSRPLPMAIAVLGLPPTTADDARHAARLDLALLAYKLGYFVVDILEVSPDADPAGYRRIERLAEQIDADAFVCRGAVDRPRLDQVADRIHMVIRCAAPFAEVIA